MGAASSAEFVESYRKRILPDGVYLDEDGRKGLATLVIIDEPGAGTDSPLLSVLEQIGTNHPLTSSNLKILGEIADSIASVTVRPDSLEGYAANRLLRVKCALQAIDAVARKATERSEGANSEELEVHLGPFTCRESAEKSLAIADNLTTDSSPTSLSSVLGQFRDMLAVEQVPYTGHSVAFEVEFFSGSADKDDCISTLHANIGVTATQLANYRNKEHQDTYTSILDIISYMANSAIRNIVAHNKIFHYISDEFGDPPPKRNAAYQYKSDAIRNLAVLENEKNKAQEEKGEAKSEFEPQIGRLELKGFGLGRGADRDVATSGIEAFWYTLDNPALAKTLQKDLKSILAAADIDMSKVPVIRNPVQGNIPWNNLTAEDWRRIDEWTVDFGYIDKDDNQLKGRQVASREPMLYYLKEFINCNEATALPQAVERALAINLAAAEWKECEERVRSKLAANYPEMTGAVLEKQIDKVVSVRLAAQEQSRRNITIVPHAGKFPVHGELSQNPHRPGPERSSPERRPEMGRGRAL